MHQYPEFFLFENNFWFVSVYCLGVRQDVPLFVHNFCLYQVPVFLASIFTLPRSRQGDPLFLLQLLSASSVSALNLICLNLCLVPIHWTGVRQDFNTWLHQIAMPWRIKTKNNKRRMIQIIWAPQFMMEISWHLARLEAYSTQHQHIDSKQTTYVEKQHHRNKFSIVKRCNLFGADNKLTCWLSVSLELSTSELSIHMYSYVVHM